MASQVTTVYTYQLNGVTVDFKIPFDYLSRKFVKVTLLGKDRKELTFMTDYRFMSPTLIRTIKAWGSSDGYNYIEIRRETSARDLIVDFSDGSILRAGDLNTANLQAMHIAEEARSLAADSLGVDDFGNLDARFRKIVNLGDPVGRKDAVTKGYIDDAKDGVIQARNKAQQYRDEAQRFRNEAESFKNQASTYKTQAESAKASAESAKSTAVTKASEASNSASSAQGSATKATQMASQAQTSASAAKTSQTQAKASETNAKTSETNAKKSETSALSSANKAATSEANAKRYADESKVAQGAADRSEAAATRAEAAKNTIVGKETIAVNAAKEASGYKDSAAKSAQDAKGYADSINPSLLMPKTGGTFTGLVSIDPSPSGDGLFGIRAAAGRSTFITLYPNNASEQHKLISNTERGLYYYSPKGTRLVFPKVNGTIAVADDYVPKTGGDFSGYLNTGFNSSQTTGKFNIYHSNNKERFQFEFQAGNQMVFWSPSGGYTIRLPKKTGWLAMAEDTINKTALNSINGYLRFSGSGTIGFELNHASNRGIIRRCDEKEMRDGKSFLFYTDGPFGKSTIYVPKRDGLLAVADDYVPKTGGTFTGSVNHDATIYMKAGTYVQWTDKAKDNRIGIYRPADTAGALTYFRRGTYGNVDVIFPSKSGTIALTSDIPTRKQWVKVAASNSVAQSQLPLGTQILLVLTGKKINISTTVPPYDIGSLRTSIGTFGDNGSVSIQKSGSNYVFGSTNEAVAEIWAYK